MGVLFGHLQLADSDRPFTIVQGQEMMYRETQEVFARWNMEFEDTMDIFIAETTSNFKERFKLPGNGFLQEESSANSIAPSAVVKASGQWDVAYPLRQYGAAMTWDDVTLSYMSLQEYENHVQTVINQNNATLINLILKAVFNPSPAAFRDPIHGTIQPVGLANGDGVLYPPKFGSTTEATENLYLAPGYTEAQISNTNDPTVAVRDTLEPHFGFPQGGSPIVAFFNTSAVQYLRALAGFDEFTNRYLVPGSNVTTLYNLPESPASGRIVGVCNGVVIVEWPRIPTGYCFGIHLDAVKPLKRRRDPEDTGLGVGLQMVAEESDHPFRSARWRHRVGFGVGNRLNGVVINFNSGGTYGVPALFQ